MTLNRRYVMPRKRDAPKTILRQPELHWGRPQYASSCHGKKGNSTADMPLFVRAWNIQVLTPEDQEQQQTLLNISSSDRETDSLRVTFAGIHGRRESQE